MQDYPREMLLRNTHFGSGPARVLVAAGSLLLTVACLGGGTKQPVSAPRQPSQTTYTPSPLVGGCSASELMLQMAEQDLPDGAARTRRRALVSALTCDYVALGRLALAGPGEFVYSAGRHSGAPALYWEGIETDGTGKPLADLVRVLSLPPGTLEIDGDTLFVWPAAAAKQSPSEQDWNDLATVFSSSTMQTLRAADEQGRGYSGWRLGILSGGDWLFFVAGGGAAP